MQNADWLGSEADEIRTLAGDATIFGLPLILTDLVRRAHPAPGARFLSWPSDPGLASGPAFGAGTRRRARSWSLRGDPSSPSLSGVLS